MKLSFGVILLVIATFTLTCKSPINSKEKTILLKGNGEVSFQPNEVRISLILNCLNMDINSSRNCIIAESQKLNEVLLNQGIKPEDILTTSINLSKEYKWRNNSRVFAGYNSSISTRLTIRNMRSLEKLYADLLENENITVRNLSYSHSKLDSLNQKAYLNALENANNLADNLLVQINGSKKEISRISNMNFLSENIEENGLTEEERSIMLSNGDPTEIKINNGILKINRSLIVEYKIK